MKIVGFDAGPNQVKALKAGTVQALVAQEPGVIGQYGVDEAVAVTGGRTGDPEGSDRIHRHHQGQRRRLSRWRGVQIQLLEHRCAVPVFLPAPRAPAASAIPNAIISAAAKGAGQSAQRRE